MARKTFEVEKLKNSINAFLATSTGTPESRKPLLTILEDVLHATDNYHGFQYLGADKVPDGQLPGINWGHVGDYEASFFNTDNTRVVYF